MMIRITLLVFVMTFFGCQSKKEASPPMKVDKIKPYKKVIYQVFPRLFGNINTANKPWGTLAENGTGKFSDFSEKVLQEIKDLGITHIWYTGVPHHALITDYTAFGISKDDPDIVKPLRR